MKKSLLIGAVFMSLLLPVQALACACCSNEGDYLISFRRPEEYVLNELKRLRLGQTATLYQTEADLEDVSVGITNPQESYPVTGSLTGSAWKINFGSGTAGGVLELLLPVKMLSFAADIHDEKKSGGGGPLLYKEWRFEGLARGTGIFKSGFTRPVKYFLVFQGRGNGCHAAEDFNNWRLEITGAKANYSFYGEMGRPD